MKNLIKKRLLLLVMLKTMVILGSDVQSSKRIEQFDKWLNDESFQDYDTNLISSINDVFMLASFNNTDSLYFKPVVRREGNKVYITKTLQKNESLIISLFDEEAKVLYREEIIGGINLEKILNISKLQKGTYKLYMSSGNNNYSYMIELQ